MTTGLARRAALVSIARLCNQGLALLSPIILVRLLPVAEFGEYRRFYLYCNLISVIAVMGVNSSLLYFIPRAPEAMWHTIKRSASLIALSSCAIAALVYAGDRLTGGLIIGDRVHAVLLYMLLFVNIDFWENLALARKQPLVVLGYSLGRLLARMTTVIVTAVLTSDVDAIIMSLLGVETVRIAISALVWWRMSDAAPDTEAASPRWREIFAYAWPVGLSVLVLTFSKQSGSVIIERIEGEVALAYFTIGGYVSVIVATLRNSISDVLLPELSATARRDVREALPLWQRSTVVFAILLIPPAVLLFCFAEPIIETVFSASYLPATPVFQIFVLVLLRECFDFDLAFRAFGKTRQGLRGHVMTLFMNVGLCLLLVPRFGIVGAAIALVVSRGLIAFYLAQQVALISHVRPAHLLPWGDLLKVLGAAVVGSSVLIPAWAYPQFGWSAIIPASIIFAVVFFLLLRAWDVAEVRWLWSLLGRRFGLRHS